MGARQNGRCNPYCTYPKGSAGNIGATDLQAQATKLEKACADKASTEAITALFEQTKASLNEVLDDLQRFFDANQVER